MIIDVRLPSWLHPHNSDLRKAAFEMMKKDEKGRLTVDEVVRNVQNWSAEDPAHQRISHDDLNKFAETFRRCAGSKGYLEREDFAQMVSSKNVSYSGNFDCGNQACRL